MVKHKSIYEFLKILKYKIDLNRFKFQYKLLYRLGIYLKKFYKKRIEFNIVNLRSKNLNIDILTSFLTMKITRRKKNYSPQAGLLSFKIQRGVKFPRVKNNIAEIMPVEKIINMNIIENNYENLNINSLTGVKDNNYEHYDSKHEDILNKLLLSFYNGISYVNKDNCNIINTIFKKIIKHKNMGGVKFEISGRLTRRYRADRAVYISRIIGGLNNPDASLKRISSVVLRGYLNVNVESTIFTSKRRIGAFAVKGWISGRNFSTKVQNSFGSFPLDPLFFTDFVKGSSLTRYYSAVSTKVVRSNEREISQLDPMWVSGFTDGEGCFHVSSIQQKDRKLGWAVRPRFILALHEKDQPVLEDIRDHFGGKIFKQGSETLQLRIENLKDLDAVIKHYELYPLNTQKRGGGIIYS